MMSNEDIITKVCKPMQEAGMRLLGYHDVANAVNSAIIIAKKELIDELKSYELEHRVNVTSSHTLKSGASNDRAC